MCEANKNMIIMGVYCSFICFSLDQSSIKLLVLLTTFGSEHLKHVASLMDPKLFVKFQF